MAEVLDGERCIWLTSDEREVKVLVKTLMESAKSLEEGIETVSWILRVTEKGKGSLEMKQFIWIAVHELTDKLLGRIKPLPPPEPVIQFILSNQLRIFAVFGRKRNPLVGLLEMYTKAFRTDLHRITAGPSTPSSRLKVESLRVRFVAVVDSIRQAIGKVERDVFTTRSYNSLMAAYNIAEEYEETEKIWKLISSEGGFGIDQRTVSVVSLLFAQRRVIFPRTDSL